MTAGNGFVRIAYAALSAVLDGAAGVAIAVADAFIAIARRKGVAAHFGRVGARICIRAADALNRASVRAGKVAYPARRT